MAALLLTLALLVAPTAHPGLEDYHHREISTGALYWRGASQGEVEWTEKFLPRALDRIEKRLGRQLDEPFTTVLVDRYEELARWTRSLGAEPPGPFTRGIAFPQRRWILVRGDLIEARLPEDPTAVTLAHEIAHLVLHRKRYTSLPRWLDEGVAVWVSGGQITPQDEAQLSFLARLGGLYRFRTIEKAFPTGHTPTSIAYQQSYLIILHIVELHGEKALREILDGLEAGRSLDTALEAATGNSLKRLEQQFHAWAAARMSWLHLTWTVLAHPWGLVALLALVAIARSWFRKRRELRQMERDEAASDEDDRDADEDISAGEMGI